MTPQEKANQGLRLLKEAILETINLHPEGLRNADIAHMLDIRSDYLGGKKITYRGR